jgi:CRP-like cAMP-binding protein
LLQIGCFIIKFAVKNGTFNLNIIEKIKSIIFSGAEKNTALQSILPLLTQQEQHFLSGYLHIRTFKTDEAFYNQEAPSVAVYYIQEGSVGIFLQTQEDREERVQYLSTGRWFGLSALFTDSPRPQSAKALENTTVACLLHSDLSTLQISHPQLFCKLLIVFLQEVNTNFNEQSVEYTMLLAKLAKSNILV